jgi:DNA-binding HxlR family transcriptional regulator
MPTELPQICAAEVIFRIVRGRWALPLLLVLAEQGPLHFLAIHRVISGVSRKVLTEQLRHFEQAGVVNRCSTQSRTLVFYELTHRGRELKKAVDGLNGLAGRWLDL